MTKFLKHERTLPKGLDLPIMSELFPKVTSDEVDHDQSLEDAKRDAQRNMTWFALSGMVLYPMGIFLCTLIGMDTAAMLIADIANIYVVSVSALVGAYFGFNAIGNKK